METWYYEVVSIDGDYANLRRTDIDSDDIKLVARALLPENISALWTAMILSRHPPVSGCLGSWKRSRQIW